MAIELSFRLRRKLPGRQWTIKCRIYRVQDKQRHRDITKIFCLFLESNENVGDGQIFKRMVLVVGGDEGRLESRLRSD